MLQKIKSSLMSLMIVAFATLPLLLAGGAVANAADNTTIQGGVCGGADNLSLDSTAGNGCNITGQSNLDHILTVVINIFSVVVGVVAVIMIIVGGFRYITSGGKQESVTGAKNTLLYAIIGLVIVALAQIIVRFVLNKATSTS